MPSAHPGGWHLPPCHPDITAVDGGLSWRQPLGAACIVGGR